MWTSHFCRSDPPFLEIAVLMFRDDRSLLPLSPPPTHCYLCTPFILSVKNVIYRDTYAAKETSARCRIIRTVRFSGNDVTQPLDEKLVNCVKANFTLKILYRIQV